MNNNFLPMTPEELHGEQLDFIVVTPDAYVDHPSFAAAIIGRFVESLGFRVGILAQPDWRSDTDFLKLGTPRYAFLLSGGNMDGIVNMYTAAKKARSEDAYSPGGQSGLRPPRPTIAYTARLKQSHKDTPVIIGGIEATQRRFAHYDYIEDKVRRSYLVDSKADLLVYGMGEKPIAEICTRFKNGQSVQDMVGIRGTCLLHGSLEGIGEHTTLPSYERVADDKKTFAAAFKTIYLNGIPAGKTLVQAHGDRYVIQFPPSHPLSTPEMDTVYGLPFQKLAHPSYKEPIPALAEVQFGITALRGCPSMCAFCSISSHQGKRIQKRSKRSIVEETKRIAQMGEFKGNISDVGGPTANFYDAICTNKNSQSCTRSCLTPTICPHLRVSHKGLTEVLEAVEKVPGVKRVFIRSGLRYDYIMADRDNHFFERLVKKHVSGQLKVAPEHVNENVLALMNKPNYGVYERFAKRFAGATARTGKPQYLLPYYISSHPGSTLQDAIELAVTLKRQGFVPDQVQDFYPTPGTLSTCMYYTGIDPLTGKDVYVAKTPREKAMQRALLAFDKKRNWPLIREALTEAGREDLIGRGKECLVPEESASRGAGRSEAHGRSRGRAPVRSASRVKAEESEAAQRSTSPRSERVKSSTVRGAQRDAIAGKTKRSENKSPAKREGSSGSTGRDTKRDAKRGEAKHGGESRGGATRDAVRGSGGSIGRDTKRDAKRGEAKHGGGESRSGPKRDTARGSGDKVRSGGAKNSGKTVKH